jgi:dTDP-4-dehydrorhamnose reductase
MADSKFLVIGASGFVGREFLRAVGAERALGTFSSHPFPGAVHFDARTMRLADLGVPLGSFSHGIILLANASIDGCARDPRSAWDLNVRAATGIVNDLQEAGVIPVFASSDAVFDGVTGGYTEASPLSPTLTYGRHKAAVEAYLQALPGPWIIARLSKTVAATSGIHSLIGEWLDDFRAGKPIKCARDQRFAPAAVADVVRALIALAERRLTGLYNCGGPDALSRLELLQNLVRQIRETQTFDPVISECSIRDLPFAEPRPLDTSLVSTKLYQALGSSFKRMDAVCAESAAEFFRNRVAGGRTATEVGRS